MHLALFKHAKAVAEGQFSNYIGGVEHPPFQHVRSPGVLHLLHNPLYRQISSPMHDMLYALEPTLREGSGKEFTLSRMRYRVSCTEDTNGPISAAEEVVNLTLDKGSCKGVNFFRCGDGREVNSIGIDSNNIAFVRSERMLFNVRCIRMKMTYRIARATFGYTWVILLATSSILKPQRSILSARDLVR